MHAALHEQGAPKRKHRWLEDVKGMLQHVTFLADGTHVHTAHRDASESLSNANVCTSLALLTYFWMALDVSKNSPSSMLAVGNWWPLLLRLAMSCLLLKAPPYNSLLDMFSPSVEMVQFLDSGHWCRLLMAASGLRGLLCGLRCGGWACWRPMSPQATRLVSGISLFLSRCSNEYVEVANIRSDRWLLDFCMTCAMPWFRGYQFTSTSLCWRSLCLTMIATDLLQLCGLTLR